MSDINEEYNGKLTKEQEDLIGRLINWKFNSALNYKNALKNKSSLECLELLEEMWGNTGWGDGKLSKTLWYLVEYIRMNEGYTHKEFYGEEDKDEDEGEESGTNVCKRCNSKNMIDLCGEEECNKALTEEDYKKLRVDAEKYVITRFKACKDCGLVHSSGIIRR